MAQRKLKARQGTLVLDCEGFSKLLADDEDVAALVKKSRERSMDVVVSALTVIEAVHERTDRRRVDWLLSTLRIEPVGEVEARAASTLLREAKLHGHKYAIDAVVAEMALRQQRPVVMLTSDLDDMSRLCGERVRLVGV
jgi:predicted nucleic acid-binding protein